MFCLENICYYKLFSKIYPDEDIRNVINEPNLTILEIYTIIALMMKYNISSYDAYRIMNTDHVSINNIVNDLYSKQHGGKNTKKKSEDKNAKKLAEKQKKPKKKLEEKRSQIKSN